MECFSDPEELSGLTGMESQRDSSPSAGNLIELYLPFGWAVEFFADGFKGGEADGFGLAGLGEWRG